MSSAFSATVTVSGDPAELQAFRMRANELLAEEDVDDFRELHTVDRLDWRFRLKSGIPFPPLVAASAEFPELDIHVEWQRPAQGLSGEAVIRNGALTQQAGESSARSDGGEACYDLRVAAGGRLELALAARSWRGGQLIGYALNAGQHAWFHVAADGGATVLSASDGMEPEWAERWTVTGEHAVYGELGTREPIDAGMLKELQRLASDLVAEWIWFAASPPEEIIVERQRYEQYGLAMHEANVRSHKLRTVMAPHQEGGWRLEASRPDVVAARELLERCWVQSA